MLNDLSFTSLMTALNFYTSKLYYVLYSFLSYTLNEIFILNIVQIYSYKLTYCAAPRTEIRLKSPQEPESDGCRARNIHTIGTRDTWRNMKGGFD